NVYFDPKDVVESGEMQRMLQILRDRPITAVDYGKYLDALPVPVIANGTRTAVGTVG
ncbi:MAG: hypothetical protein HOL51_15110, partial [Gemmatimonadetes bacterium]|nr:hypothetical protein [Gemmatimonadota bacterium]